MQRILSVYDWQYLKPETAMVVESDLDHQRLVRLRVNAPSAVTLYLQQPEIEEDLFLARVEGLDDIEFNITGGYKLFAVGGELWFDTLDGTRPDVEPVEPTSFTNIVERRAHNTEFQLMELLARQNALKREQELLAAVDTRFATRSAELAKMEADLAAARKALEDAGGKVPGSGTGQVPPDSSAQQAAGGTGGQSNAE